MANELTGTFPPDLPGTVVAWRSWRSLKRWVLVWLWYLNVLYWVAFLYLPREEAIWVIASYLAVGPFIATLVAMQRGLTRLSGLIHLPWVPLTAYLGLRLFTDQLGPAVSTQHGALYAYWLHLVFWSTLACLALDTADVVRWLLGERYVMGTPLAAAHDASRLAPEWARPARPATADQENPAPRPPKAPSTEETHAT